MKIPIASGWSGSVSLKCCYLLSSGDRLIIAHSANLWFHLPIFQTLFHVYTSPITILKTCIMFLCIVYVLSCFMFFKCIISSTAFVSSILFSAEEFCPVFLRGATKPASRLTRAYFINYITPHLIIPNVWASTAFQIGDLSFPFGATLIPKI